MKLTLDRLDMKNEYRDVNCSQVKFEYFKTEVQLAIRAVGRATFWNWDRKSYNSVRPPKEG